jgi:hypothetical protein
MEKKNVWPHCTAWHYHKCYAVGCLHIAVVNLLVMPEFDS